MAHVRVFNEKGVVLTVAVSLRCSHQLSASHRTISGVSVSDGKMTALPVTAEPRGRLDERQLIARVLAGEARAQRELYEIHVDRVYRLAYRLAGEDELARDFTQLTFIRAFERI